MIGSENAKGRLYDATAAALRSSGRGGVLLDTLDILLRSELAAEQVTTALEELLTLPNLAILVACRPFEARALPRRITGLRSRSTPTKRCVSLS